MVEGNRVIHSLHKVASVPPIEFAVSLFYTLFVGINILQQYNVGSLLTKIKTANSEMTFRIEFNSDGKWRMRYAQLRYYQC